jgi:hypothetical protein
MALAGSSCGGSTRPGSKGVTQARDSVSMQDHSQMKTSISAMERTGIEPVTPSLQSWCSPS